MAALPMIKEIGPLERVYSRPSWADPSFLMLSSQWQYRDVSVGSSVLTPVIPPDPKRWAIGFNVGQSVIGGILCGPFNDPAEHGFSVPTGPLERWFTIFTYGPIVCDAWYAFSTGSIEMRVTLITIQG